MYSSVLSLYSSVWSFGGSISQFHRGIPVPDNTELECRKNIPVTTVQKPTMNKPDLQHSSCIQTVPCCLFRTDKLLDLALKINLMMKQHFPGHGTHCTANIFQIEPASDFFLNQGSQVYFSRYWESSWGRNSLYFPGSLGRACRTR